MGELPLKKFRAGSVTATIWENTKTLDGQEQVFKTISVEKNYKQDKNWKTTNSYGVNDLYRLRSVIDKALEFSMVKDEEVKAKE